MKLKHYLQKIGKSSYRASKELGCNRQSVLNWANGLTIPGPVLMAKIVRWSNGEVQPNDFFDLDNPQSGGAGDAACDPAELNPSPLCSAGFPPTQEQAA